MKMEITMVRMRGKEKVLLNKLKFFLEVSQNYNYATRFFQSKRFGILVLGDRELRRSRIAAETGNNCS